LSHQDTVDLLTETMQPLAPWGSDHQVEELTVNKPDEVFVRKNGKFERHDIELSFDDCYDIAILAAAIRRQTVGDHAPIVGADIPFGTGIQRLQAMLPPTVQSETVSLTIRRFEQEVAPVKLITSRYDTSRWNQWLKRNEAREADYVEALKAFDDGDLEVFLDVAIRMRMNILLSGSTGAGKTTLARSMMSLVDMAERIITIEDALELVIRQPNNVRLLHSKGGLSADGVTPKKLLEAALRMRPSRIVLQELRDSESAYVYVNEALTGHPGSITTIHGGSAPQAFKRLFTLVKGSEEGQAYGDDLIIDLLANAVDVIIPLENWGSQYAIRETFFVADAARRGETARNLMGG
jgi:type IV secretion system protein VirB11